MTQKIKALFILAISLIICVSLFSCEQDGAKATFALSNETIVDGVHTIYVSSDIETINIQDYAIISDDAKLKVYKTEDMEDELDTTISLESGSNTFYLRVKEGSTKKYYNINIIRRKIVTVSFDVNGGSSCASITVDEGDVITPPTTTRIGYDFVKWDYDFSNPINSDVFAKAEWTPKSYNISISWNGIDVSEFSVKFGEDYSITPEARLGYKFVGLKNPNANNSDFPLSRKWLETEDVSLDADYALESYKITYVYNANISNKVVSYTILDNIPLETPVHPNGLEFEGWYSDQQLQNKVADFGAGNTGDKVFYAKWKQEIIPEPEVYNVQIDADGFEFDGNFFIIKYGDSYTLPIVPQREGYEFVSWLANGETVVSTSGLWEIKDDVVLTIDWDAVPYTIQYVVDAKTTNPNIIAEYRIDSATIALLDATRPNASFLGWYNENNERVTQITTGSTGNIVLYAKFQITSFVLNYNSNGGTVSKDSVTYETGDEYILLTPEYPGYNFKGWYNGETLFENGIWQFTDDVTLVAKWEKISYLITYELAGGATTETLKNVYTVEDAIILPTPTNAGYVFLGWSENGSNKVYQSVTIPKGTIGDKKFVAVWSMFSYSYSGTSATVVSYAYTTDRASVVIPKTVNYNGIDYTVTEIGASVFAGIGSKLAKKEIIVKENGKDKVATKFSVEIPNTLQKIGINAFSDCDDVSINVILPSGVELSSWADSLEVAEGNDHVVDVIKGRRPAIGWSVYG